MMVEGGKDERGGRKSWWMFGQTANMWWKCKRESMDGRRKGARFIGTIKGVYRVSDGGGVEGEGDRKWSCMLGWREKG